MAAIFFGQMKQKSDWANSGGATRFWESVIQPFYRLRGKRVKAYRIHRMISFLSMVTPGQR
jgi:hypothetical protein